MPEDPPAGVTVEVYGNSFTFKNVESTSLLQSAASRLESHMKELSEKWRIVDKTKLAIMAALEMSIELVELSENAERGRRVARGLLESLDRTLPPETSETAPPDDEEPFLLS